MATQTVAVSDATGAGNPPLIVVKLGGAALTNKRVFETANESAIAATMREFVAALVHKHCAKVVVVHGAGSFGHMQAAASGLADGWDVAESACAPPRIADGLAATRASVLKLNALVVGAAAAAGLPAVGVSPFSALTDGGSAVELDAFVAARLPALLRVGLVPVLHGDVVLSGARGCAILSGDTLVEVLARVLRPQWCVFLTDVAGVYTADPRDCPSARLIRRLDAAALADVSTAAVAGAPIDVTGGFSAKIAAARVICCTHRVPVVIAAAQAARELAAALSSECPERQVAALECTLLVP